MFRYKVGIMLSQFIFLNFNKDIRSFGERLYTHCIHEFVKSVLMGAIFNKNMDDYKMCMNGMLFH